MRVLVTGHALTISPLLERRICALPQQAVSPCKFLGAQTASTYQVLRHCSASLRVWNASRTRPARDIRYRADVQDPVKISGNRTNPLLAAVKRSKKKLNLARHGRSCWQGCRRSAARDRRPISGFHTPGSDGLETYSGQRRYFAIVLVRITLPVAQDKVRSNTRLERLEPALELGTLIGKETVLERPQIDCPR